ncbi:MAG: hypothetical protein ABSA02_28835 [Trebonia sp.]|jgi:hypothetical protein
MATWVIWGIFVGVGALLGFVGYHFSLRTLRVVGTVTGLALVLAVTAYGLRHAASTTANFESALALGADKVAAVLFQPLRPGHHVPAPGRAGWVVISVLLLLGYRELEAWSLHWQAPQLDTSKLAEGQPSIKPDGAPREPAGGLTDGQRHDQLAAALKFRLAAIEVRAPAILPGGSRSVGLATIAESSGVGGAGLAGAIIRFFGMLWPNPRQVQLRVWVEPGPTGADEKTARPADRTRVTVELENPTTGESMATQTLAAADIDEAASRVAGYVGRAIFTADPTTPPWCYGAPDGDDLAALLRVRQERVSTQRPVDMRRSRSRQIEILGRAAGSSRCAGVVRYELAQLYSIRGRASADHLAALRLHAVNRERYPRFYRGRYRLGMSLEMMANPQFRFTDRKTTERELDEILGILYRCDLTRKRRCGAADIVTASGGESWELELSPSLRLELLRAAAIELRGVRRQLTFRRVAWAALAHRDERTIWESYFSGLRLRQSFHDGACVAQLLVAVRRRQNETAGEARPADGSPPPLTPRHLGLAIRVASAIAGRDDRIESIVKHPRDQWPLSAPSTDTSGPKDPRDRLRRLPLLRRTASWQAAYNTACLYAAVAAENLAAGPETRGAWEDRVIVSLRRVVNNPYSEMGRPYDLISSDPDFSALRSAPEKFPHFKKFLDEQGRMDYSDYDSDGSGDPVNLAR